jgi:O-antigen/teichoic acid export membrane protein
MQEASILRQPLSVTAELNLDVPPDAAKTQEFRQYMGTVSRHSGVFLAGSLFTVALGYLFKIYLARTLGARDLGIYALGMTIVAFLRIFNSLGLPRSAVRYVAAYRATGKLELLRGFLARSLLLLLTFNVLLGATMLLLGPWIAVHFYQTPEIRTYLPLFALIMIAAVLTAFLEQVLAGYKSVAGRTVIANFIGTPASIIFTIVLVTAGLRLWGYLFAQLIAACLVLALMAGLAWRLTPKAARSFSGTLPPMEKEVVTFSRTAAGSSLLDYVKTQSDRIAIGFYLDATSVGVYSIAAALVSIVPIVQTSANQIFAPTIADLNARGEHELLKRMFQTIAKWVVGLTAPLAFVMMIYSREFMQIFGREFQAAWLVLIIGTTGRLVDCGVGSAGTLLLMSGRQNLVIKIRAVTAVFMVALSVAMVPRWGITGAALASALTVAITQLCYLIGVRRELKFYPYNSSFLRLAVPLASTAAVIILLHSRFAIHRAWLGIAVGLVLAYAVFAGLAAVFSLDQDDRVIARAVWARLGHLSGQRA